MDPTAHLRQVGLFAGLDDRDLRRVAREAGEVHLAPGERLFSEGDQADAAYVVLAGSVEVVKAAPGREVLVAVREVGSVVGEMALLEDAPRTASVRARGPAVVLTITKTTLDEVLEASPSAARVMFRTLAARMRETEQRLRHHERLAQLGTLTAGVAHELNNPAAAVRRAAHRLDDEVGHLLELVTVGGTAGREAAELLAARAVAESEHTTSLAQADAEAELEAWLESHGVPDAWRAAPELVALAVDLPALEGLADRLGESALAEAVDFLVTAGAARRLVDDVAVGARRLTEVIGTLKGYAYLDRGPLQEVDVVQGIEDTLALLAGNLRGIRIERDFATDLPRVSGNGGALNQVWTNLIDNAADALGEPGGPAAPTLRLRARSAGSDVLVEVEDNGPGLPAEISARVFDAFFTTKPPGQGTGLGLHLSRQIVVLDHGGELRVESVPGRTTFQVALPVRGVAEA